MTVRIHPQPDALVEIDIPAGPHGAAHTVTRRISVWRALRDDGFACILADLDGRLSSAAIARNAAGRWACMAPPVSLEAPPAGRSSRP